MSHYKPNERAFKQLFPGVHTRTFWGEQHLLSLVDLDANTVLPKHSHPHEQSTFVLKGELEVEMAGETYVVRSGEFFIFPSGVEHCVRVGASPVQVLDVFVPAREDLKY
jgi:quercetin dioxygenase-like cupin family protein